MSQGTSIDRNAVSLALCHAKAVLELLTEADLGTHADAIETVIHFVDQAKGMIDGEDRPSGGTP
jgi:hypothetical protein